MRQGRLKVPPSHAVGYYHCMSRVVNRQFIFTDEEKERLHDIMRDAELFCAIKVLTHAFLDNHFHMLVEVPRRPEVMPTAEELIQRLQQLKHPPDIEQLQRRIAHYRRHQDQAGEETFLERYWARMWDVSRANERAVKPTSAPRLCGGRGSSEAKPPGPRATTTSPS